MLNYNICLAFPLTENKNLQVIKFTSMTLFFSWFLSFCFLVVHNASVLNSLSGLVLINHCFKYEHLFTINAVYQHIFFKSALLFNVFTFALKFCYENLFPLPTKFVLNDLILQLQNISGLISQSASKMFSCKGLFLLFF